MNRYMIFAFCVLVLIMSGCNEPQTPSEKQSRLIAAENMELKKQIEELNLEIEQLRGQHQKEIEVQKNLLTDTQNVLDTVIAKNSDLHREIEKLKSELEKMLTEKTEQQ